jgi:ribonuclease HII
MNREDADRLRAEALLAFDLAVSSALEGRGLLPEGVEIPFDGPPSPEVCHRPSSRFASVGVSEAGRGRTPRPHLRLAGFDEAGRGALAGPVVVACVHLDTGSIGEDPSACDLVDVLRGADDSKRLSAAKRERLFDRIVASVAFGVGAASAGAIDRSGIVGACRIAACRAYRNLGVDVDAGLFDRGLSLRGGAGGPVEGGRLLPEATAVGADGRSLHVACASILAKVTRDRMMRRLGRSFSGYALERHKGYGTAAHREAIRALGPTPIHRRTFLRGCESAKSQSC